jgi:hypothetical protein
LKDLQDVAHLNDLVDLLASTVTTVGTTTAVVVMTEEHDKLT